MRNCSKCDDTGVIKTGNNDLPCICPAGDTATFNVAGEGELTGLEIKRRSSLPKMPTKIGDRYEHGHHFKWHKRPGFWRSTSGRYIIIVPPTSEEHTWIVIDHSDKEHEISGHDAERRAFAVAAGLVR